MKPTLVIIIDDACRDQVRRDREMSPEEKFFAGPRLFEYACRVTCDGIRHQNPGIAEEDVFRTPCERLELARRLENMP